jgi:hypothetical protein
MGFTLLRDAGRYVELATASTPEHSPPSRAAVNGGRRDVRRPRSRRRPPPVTDGPFAESKEMLGGGAFLRRHGT